MRMMGEGSFGLAQGMFSSRFRALIIAQRQPPVSATANTAMPKCRCLIIKTRGRDGHTPSPSPRR